MALGVLSVMNWLHQIATVIWIGGMMLIPLVIVPAAKMSLEPAPLFGKFMGAFSKKFKPLAYTSIVVLMATGFVMMALNRHYEGMGDVNTLWAVMMLIKHLLVVVMIIIGAMTGSVIGGKIEKLIAGGDPSKPPPPELGKLQGQQLMLARINLMLGLIVLLLTGICGAVSSL